MTLNTVNFQQAARPSFRHSVFGTRELDRFNIDAGLPVQFSRLREAPTIFEIEGGQSQSLSLWRTRSETGFLTVPKARPDVITVRFIMEGAILRRDRRSEHVGRLGHAMMVMFDEMLSEEASSGFTALSATITKKALVSAHHSLEGEDSGPLPRFFPISDAAGLPLQTLMRTMNRIYLQLESGVPQLDLVFPLIEEIMIYQVLSAWPRKSSDRVRNATFKIVRPVQRAKEYIEANLSRKLQLHEIASESGLGVRRLQTLFRADTGKTPLQFILDRRLDHAHADLHSSEEGASVTAIATRWGFTHMSDFGRRYRERFGEVPSLTLRRHK